MVVLVLRISSNIFRSVIGLKKKAFVYRRETFGQFNNPNNNEQFVFKNQPGKIQLCQD